MSNIIDLERYVKLLEKQNEELEVKNKQMDKAIKQLTKLVDTYAMKIKDMEENIIIIEI